MIKKVLLVLAAIFILLLISITAFGLYYYYSVYGNLPLTQNSKSGTVENISAQWNRYTNKSLGLQMDIPATMKVVEKFGNEQFQAEFADDTRSSFIVIAVEESTDNKIFSQDTVDQAYFHYNIQTGGNIIDKPSIQGRPAKRLKTPKGQLNPELMMTILDGDRLVRIRLSSKAAQSLSYEEMEKTLASFKFSD